MKKEILYIILGIVLAFMIFGIGYLIGTQYYDQPEEFCPNWKDYASLQNEIRDLKNGLNPNAELHNTN